MNEKKKIIELELELEFHIGKHFIIQKVFQCLDYYVTRDLADESIV